MVDWAHPFYRRPLPPFAGLHTGDRREATRHASLREFVLLAIGVGDARTLISDSPEDEAALVRRMGEPGSPATQEVYRRYARRVYRFLYRRLNEQVEDAEDLTLETFMAAVKLASGFDGRSSVFGWLCGIAKLRLIDYHRRGNRAKRGPGGDRLQLAELEEMQVAGRIRGGGLDQILEQISAQQLVEAALATMNAEEREALTLFYVEELSLREVAAVMRRSEKAVGSLLSRAKAKPRKYLLHLMSDSEVPHGRNS